MWEDFVARIEENERDRPLPIRKALFEVLRDSGLRPGGGVTKKMVSFEFGLGERILWELQRPANFFLHAKWRDQVETTGLDCEPRSFQKGLKDGGRHSALSRDWSFGDDDCIVVQIDNAGDLHKLLAVLLSTFDELVLNSAVVARWIERLRHFFPDLDRFDRPDPTFDEAERDYKLEVSAELKAAITRCKSDQDLADAVHAALVKSNLLQWRVYWSMSPKGDADREKLWPALREFVDAALGPIDGHASALEAFVDTWIDAVPNGKPDPARQIGEFLLLHLAPEQGIYIRHSVRQDLWLEAVESRFPDHVSLADTYRDEWRFMNAVRLAFVDQGLAPRDMIDVQSALWIVHNYKNNDEANLARDAIEAAMDAYDEYRQSGEHASIFDAFGEPSDYWVRSTRRRTDRIYPTKPIRQFVDQGNNYGGGWARPHRAATILHNAGFVIVDKIGEPVILPAQYSHLMSGADRIRLVAANYYIEPARERGETKVSIAVSDLAKMLSLDNSFPNICSALEGRKFQELAGVPPPTSTIPNPSSTTVFTYRLSERSNLMSEETMPARAGHAPTNLILYGPPGTGKTYSTAFEAVRLCIGDDAVTPPEGDRGSVMSRYKELVDAGQIDFVTFHQSLSYEDFVEGLRPTTGSGGPDGQDEPGGSAVGFSLQVRDGIFKRISERARLDVAGPGSGKRLDRSRRVFKVALGRRQVDEDRIQYGLNNDVIHLGWGGDLDWSDERFDHFDEILSEWRDKVDPSATGFDGNVVITYSLRADAQTGDYVVLSDGRDRLRAVGELIGEYYFAPDAEFHPHRRKVRWLWKDDAGVERSRFYPNGFRQHSVYKLDQKLIDWDALDEIVFGTDFDELGANARSYVLVIDEINRANISKVFGELITLLEPDKRLGAENEIRLVLPYSGKSFGVPRNLHIIGTMNTADRSIALLDTALRRRFSFRELMPEPDLLSPGLDGIDLRRLLGTLNERIEYLFDREHQIGHAYFFGCQSRADITEVLRFKVIPLLSEYFYEDWSKVDAVLGAGKFLTKQDLKPPPGLEIDDLSEPKQSWRVRDEFDLSEFEVS